MRNKIWLFASAVLLASCSTGDNKEQQLQQHLMDSAVNAKVALRQSQNAYKNDSTLRALEKEKADSMEKEQGLDGKKKDKISTNKPKPATDSLNSSLK